MKGGEHAEKSTSENALANASQAMTQQPEATIDQVRDLLFGGAQRSMEGQLGNLREEMQASLKKLQAEFAKELEALQAKVSELERDTEQKHLASYRDIGAAISELGATVSKLSPGGTGK